MTSPKKYVNYLPVLLNLENKKVLIVGGGNIAYQKVSVILDSDAEIHVLSETFCEEMLAAKDRIRLIKKSFEATDLEGYFFVIGATDDPEINETIHELCEEKNILVNIVDVTHLCRFIFSSVIRRGPLIIAISSSGRAPFFTRYFASRMRKSFPEKYTDYMDILSEARDELKQKIPSFKSRLPYFQQMLAPEIKKTLFKENKEKARQMLKEIVDAAG